MSESCNKHFDCYISLAVSATLLTSIVFFGLAFESSNIKKLGTPYDLNADICGEEILNKNYLYFPDFSHFEYPICIEKCPEKGSRNSSLIPTNNEGAIKIIHKQSSLFLGHYCLPETFNLELFKNSLFSNLPALVLFQDFFKSIEVLFIIITILICIFSLVLKFLSYPAIGDHAASFFMFAPLILATLVSSLILSSKSYYKTAQESFIIWTIVILLILCTVIITLIPIIFRCTYQRSKMAALLAVQALFEMPDLMLFITAGTSIIGVITIISFISYAYILSIGSFLPIPLMLESVENQLNGISSGFKYETWKVIATIMLFFQYNIIMETFIAYAKLISIRSVKIWFESTPANGIRYPTCKIVLEAIRKPNDYFSAILTAGFASIFRIPSMILQLISSENIATKHSNPLLAKLTNIIHSLDMFRIIYNPSSLYQLNEFDGCCYTDSSFKSYKCIIEGIAPDHQAGKRYHIEEMISPSFFIVLFYCLFLFLNGTTWFLLTYTPAFNPNGEKELFSFAFPLLFSFIITLNTLTMIYETFETISVAIVLHWFKATSDIGWNSGINSDTIVDYESISLSNFVMQMRKSCN